MSRERGTNVFALLGKSIFESTAGRIRWRGNMWAVVGSKWDRNRIVSPHASFERGDHVLVKKLCTSWCPSAPGEWFYQDEKGRWHVPAVECRKCQWHRASSCGGAFRFPRCVFKKSEEAATVVKDTFTQISGLVKKATEDAKRIMRDEE